MRVETSKNVAQCMAVAITFFASAAGAQEAAPCAARITRANVVHCALDASLVVRGERQELEASEARTVAVSPLLPSNPVLALSAGRRIASSSSADSNNWYATLAQEIEIAGQRGVRRKSAEAAVEAQSKRVLLSRREVAALAWVAFFEAIAARDELRLADRFTATTQAVADVAHARADKGLIAPIDADVADATALRVFQLKLAADRRAAVGQAAIVSMLGLDPANGPLAIEGELIPIGGVDEALGRSGGRAVAERPEVLVLDAERRALELRADAFRRTRIPNPTISVFVQNDGFNERVLGAGVAFPIPLPGNVGRTYVGEIAEAEALARRVATDKERIQREIRLEITTTAQVFQSRAKEVEAFSHERVTRAETSLLSLGQEVESGRLAIRDAVVTQQALVELLRANVEARRAWCLASVDLARALGVPLEGRSP